MPIFAQMNSKLKTLLNRQRELKAKIAKERFKLADHFKPIERVFSWADRILDGVHFMKRNPVLWTTVFAIFENEKEILNLPFECFVWGEKIK